MIKRFLLGIMTLGLTTITFASTLDELLQKFADTPVKFAKFTETKNSSYLKKPVIIKGELEFRAPDTLVKHILHPEVITQKISGDDLFIFVKGKDKQYIYLPYQPELEIGINAIRWILSGNGKSLKKQFDVKYIENKQSWNIELLPKDEDISATIKDILLSGKNNIIDDIDIIQVNGDSTKTSLYEHK